ncbi:MarR family winged helix-turn-helix transcriptional regulator [Jatrophihabitans sp. YIM 134969]
MSDAPEPRPPERLRALASWQTNKVSTLGARLTAQRMPLGARTEFAVLAALEESGPLSQADLGRHLGLDRNDVNAVVNRLQDDELVVRKADPTDRRRNLVTPTPRGRRHLERLQVHADAVQDELLRGLAPSERRQLQALLDKVLSGHPAPSA